MAAPEKKAVPAVKQLRFKKGEVSTYFADYIESKITGEHVILTFGLRSYEAPETEAVPLARVYMTLPHFYRFAKLTQDNLQKVVDLGLISEEAQNEHGS